MTSIDLTRRLGALGLAEKTRLLTGATAWRLASVPAIGLRAVVTSDGPAGVRGTGETPGATSLSFACPSALAATWDTGLARTVGRLFAREARRHGVDVVLAPVVNLQRTPVGGRHFEAASEDPLLSGDIACAFIEGCQAEGVGVCVKHFVANESETMRTSYIATLDERTLREVYLAPFERACRDAHAWSVMASYNGLDDGVEVAPTIAHHRLMLGILKGEWGYDGAVISDWTAAKTAREPALGGLDLVMPGPGGPWADGALQRLVEDGHVPEECVDDKAIRLLRLAERVGALGADDTSVPATPPAPPLAAEDTDGLRRLAGASIVVLKDDDHALPWASAPGSVSLIGPNAVRTYVQGGGSAHVDPPGVITPAGALTGVFPGVAVTVAEGATARVTPPSLDVVRMIDPRTGAAGTARLAVLDAAGRLLGEHDLAEAGGHLEDLPE
ncbi:MAG: beta-glucosidase, partial [Actinomycetia bacterium]|nr:beta-glucosidase [Actinomycetes bacterium]